MKLRLTLIILLTCTTLAPTINAQRASKTSTDPLSQFSFLLGKWKAVGAIRSVVESWSRDSSGVLRGISVVVQGTDTTVSDVKRIEVDSAGVFFITDAKRNKTEFKFKLDHNDSTGACFVNPKLDFPNKFCYQPAGKDSLYFWMEGPGKGVIQRQGYRFGRVK